MLSPQLSNKNVLKENHVNIWRKEEYLQPDFPNILSKEQ